MKKDVVLNVATQMVLIVLKFKLLFNLTDSICTEYDFFEKQAVTQIPGCTRVHD